MCACLFPSAHLLTFCVTSLLDLSEIYLWTCSQGGERLVDDAFFLRNVRVLEQAFDGQFHYGMFYAFIKLKEQEVKNLVCSERGHVFLCCLPS